MWIHENPHTLKGMVIVTAIGKCNFEEKKKGQVGDKHTQKYYFEICVYKTKHCKDDFISVYTSITTQMSINR